MVWYPWLAYLSCNACHVSWELFKSWKKFSYSALMVVCTYHAVLFWKRAFQRRFQSECTCSIETLCHWLQGLLEIRYCYGHIFTEACLNHNIWNQAVAPDRRAVFRADRAQDSVFTSLMLGAQREVSWCWTFNMKNATHYHHTHVDSVYSHWDTNLKSAHPNLNGLNKQDIDGDCSWV